MNWRRHLLLFGSGESDCIGNLSKEWICHRDTKSKATGHEGSLLTGAAEECSCDWAQNLTEGMLPQSVSFCQDNSISNLKQTPYRGKSQMMLRKSSFLLCGDSRAATALSIVASLPFL